MPMDQSKFVRLGFWRDSKRVGRSLHVAPLGSLLWLSSNLGRMPRSCTLHFKLLISCLTLLHSFKLRNLVGENAGEIWYAVGVMSAVMLFGLAVFFFIFAALPYGFKVRADLRDVLSCWALTFPNGGFSVL